MWVIFARKAEIDVVALRGTFCSTAILHAPRVVIFEIGSFWMPEAGKHLSGCAHHDILEGYVTVNDESWAKTKDEIELPMRHVVFVHHA